MWAGTVVDPPGPTSAAIASATSRSRSVALKESFERSALISTFARIGMVLRRSTTRWTWPRDFRSSARSTVTFMGDPARSETFWSRGATKVAWRHGLGKTAGGRQAGFPGDSAGLGPIAAGLPARARGRDRVSLLQLAFEQLDFLRQRGVVVDQILDL